MESVEPIENKEYKRLLYIVPQFPVLTESFIRREVEKLVERGNLDVSVLALYPGSGKTTAEVMARLTYLRLNMVTAVLAAFKYVVFRPFLAMRVFVLVLSSSDNYPFLWPKKVMPGDEIKPRQSVVGNFSRTRFVHFLKGVGYAGVFEKFNPDHIHVNFLSEYSNMVMVAAQLMKIPYSISAHAKDVFVEHSLVKSKAKTAKFISICNKNTWAKTKDLAEEFDGDHIKLLYHGVDENKLRKLISSGPLPQSQIPAFVCIARLVEKKGLTYLVEASQKLKSEGVKHKVYIIGPGPLYDLLISQAKESDVLDSVEVLGEGKGLPFEEAIKYVAISTAFVAPFIQTQTGDVDGVPNTVIEATLLDKPTIATDVGSISELINSETGFIVPQRDSGALAAAMKKVIEMQGSDDLTQRVVRAKKLAKDTFDLDRNIEKLENLITAE